MITILHIGIMFLMELILLDNRWGRPELTMLWPGRLNSQLSQ